MSTETTKSHNKNDNKTTEKTEKKTSRKTTNWKTPLEFPYAVVRSGGKQYCVSKGDQVLVEKLNLDPGADFVADEVLLVASAPGKIQVGQPTIKGATVKFEVLQQTLAGKILIRHSRRRQSSQKSMGHRQPLTRLMVKEIVA